MVNLALDQGTSAFPEGTKNHSDTLREVRNVLSEELARAQSSFKKDQDQKFAIRRQQLLSHFDRKIESQERAINTARARGIDPRKTLGFEKILENLKAKREEHLAKLQDRVESSNESVAEVACGLIENRP